MARRGSPTSTPLAPIYGRVQMVGISLYNSTCCTRLMPV